MRWFSFLTLAATLGGAALSATGMPAKAAKYSVACTAVAGCSTACSSNTYAVACYATLRSGRCYKWCGRKS
jgi:hypothetical protein